MRANRTKPLKTHPACRTACRFGGTFSTAGTAAQLRSAFCTTPDHIPRGLATVADLVDFWWVIVVDSCSGDLAFLLFVGAMPCQVERQEVSVLFGGVDSLAAVLTRRLGQAVVSAEGVGGGAEVAGEANDADGVANPRSVIMRPWRAGKTMRARRVRRGKIGLRRGRTVSIVTWGWNVRLATPRCRPTLTFTVGWSGLCLLIWRRAVRRR